MAKQVNTIIALASPIDAPVLNIDFYSEAFYRKSNKFWLEHRPPISNVITNLTNTCCNASNNAVAMDGSNLTAEFRMDEQNAMSSAKKIEKYFLKDILLITIGGGKRDLLVQAGLTTSRFSDIHTMSTCIPNVWLSTDHVSSVWCVQQVLAINRFLFSIVQTTHSRQKLLGNNFIEDKALRLAKARHYLTVRLRRNFKRLNHFRFMNY